MRAFIDALCEEITAEDDDEDDEEVADEAEYDEEAVPLDMSRVKCESNSNVCFEQPINMSSKRRKLSGNKTMSSAAANLQCDVASANHNYSERWMQNGSSKATNDDEDEDDDDDADMQLADRLSEQNGAYDPERLKAFNVINSKLYVCVCDLISLHFCPFSRRCLFGFLSTRISID